MNPDRRAFLNGLVALAAPSLLHAQSRTSARKSEGELAVDIGRRFRARGVEGTFLLRSVHDDTWLVHNPARADQAFLWGSFPKGSLEHVLEWRVAHQAELEEDWERARSRQRLKPIDPLE